MLNDVTGFHIEPTNICTLKCSGCARTRFIDRWPQHWRNHNLDIDAVIRFLDINLSNKKISLCGNYGDPIYHPDFVDFVAHLKQAGAILSITTNGSYRTKNWWQDLTNYLDERDTIRFSIDGIPENFTNYRENADWISIQHGIETCVASPCNVVWKYIPFDYNQSNIDQARDLSTQLGMDDFLLERSDRFDTQTIHFLPKVKDLVGPRYEAQENWKIKSASSEVDPLCNSGKQHFITADGHYSPCCFATDYRFYYKNQFGKNKTKYDITKTTLSQLLGDSEVLRFYSNLKSHDVCQYNCPKT